MDEFTQKAASLYQSGKSLAEVAEEMKTSRGYVSRKLRASGVPPQRNTRNVWLPHEDEVLKKFFTSPIDELLPMLSGRTESAIKNRVNSLKLVKRSDIQRRVWTDEDFKFIEDNADKTAYALAKHFGVNGSSIACIRSRKGMHKKFTCKVCGVGISQQGKFCKEHLYVGKQMRAYSSKSMVRGREFDLSEDETYKLLTSKCTYCGGDGYGIDRIDSSKGYVAGNVTPCCSRCNVMKNDMTVSEFESHIRRIAAHMESK